MSSGYLILEDGTVFGGRSVAADGVAFGEAVFTTGMTGYQETVTDPSYAGQLVCFTTAMVGNYGVAEERGESAEPHAQAVLMRSLGGEDWADWLRQHGLVGLEGIDSRSLVLRLRDSGAMRAAAVCRRARALRRRGARAGSRAAVDGRAGSRRAGVDARGIRLRGERLAARRRRRLRREAIDLPAPREGGSLRDGRPAHRLGRRARAVRRRPPLERARGPGAPDARRSTPCASSSGSVPILGICLGHQLLGLATGHTTYKLPFGHRGANHPVLERRTGRVLVTSQNHGFAVAPSESSEATFVSLYDGTVEGFEFPDLQARSVQFHPEAGPGPHDAWPILEHWVEELRR